jgi:hypothetical protein
MGRDGYDEKATQDAERRANAFMAAWYANPLVCS